MRGRNRIIYVFVRNNVRYAEIEAMAYCIAVSKCFRRTNVVFQTKLSAKSWLLKIDTLQVAVVYEFSRRLTGNQIRGIIII